MQVFKISTLCLLLIFCLTCIAQKKQPTSSNLVYVDQQGILRWTSSKKVAAFFGVNYTAPFAFAYRAHKTLNTDLQKAIQQDVYHMARLGLDAFRVHIWDTEISDTAGNLLENEHLRLYDFLLAELKKRNIRTIITPIAFWGNGYPERDEKTPGFSHKYGKSKALINDTAIRAQENYLQQLFKHVNPYTKLSYGNDPDVIAVEINNEPQHSGTKSFVTSYVNRLVAAVKSTGWTKPVYYNISESPAYAEAVAKANIDGVSFQWYPTGLVANSTARGNHLPNVDRYTIPFDTIPEYRNKSLMVYEFDAADLLQSNMYPAIARSFREAGFQWATQFAYDPMAIADVNTEYQTHYLNLAYTPAKAISMLIASRAFHTLPRKKGYGSYPADSIFGPFRVSYRESLSEMKTAKEFYYSSSTTTAVETSELEHVAGVGSSAVVRYDGTGAYFFDKLETGVWRLELMPDAIVTRDPFEKASPRKEVTRIQWGTNTLLVTLPGLGTDFSVKGLNEGNSYSGSATNNSIQLQPGTYLFTAKGKTYSGTKKVSGVIGLNEFVAPVGLNNKIFVQHEPAIEVSAGKPLLLAAKVVGLQDGTVSLLMTSSGTTAWGKTIMMARVSAGLYQAEIPAEFVVPGKISYRIVVQQGKEHVSFPGNVKEEPWVWDAYHNDTWVTFVAAEKTKLEIYNPTTDQKIRTYPPFRRGYQTTYITGEQSKQLILKLSATALKDDGLLAFQHFIGDKLPGRADELNSFRKLMIRARTTNTQPVKLKLILTSADAHSYSGEVRLSDQLQDFVLPLSGLAPDSALLLPRPYPGFMPLYFKADAIGIPFKLAHAESIQVIAGYDLQQAEREKPFAVEVSSIWLEK